MNLFFNWSDIKNRQKGLTFDDILIVPSKSDVRSRRIPELKTRLTKNLDIAIPIISANMDTITECEMALAMYEQGGIGILHRFMSTEEQLKQVGVLKNKGHEIISASIGVGDDCKERAQLLIKSGVNLITIDIAHGHSVQMIETLQWLKKSFPDVQVIAGNISTPEGVLDLIEAGADAIKVGIGPGSMCTTRIITGCGVPQITAIALCAEVANQYDIPIIADGGLRNSGDIMKALSAGASSIMLGSMLSGTIETPGEVKSGKKLYRGMASKSAQTSWRGGVPEGMAAEGEATSVFIKGYVKDVVLEICGGIRSGMSYINALTVKDISNKARFIEMSGSGIRESHAHGVFPTK